MMEFHLFFLLVISGSSFAYFGQAMGSRLSFPGAFRVVVKDTKGFIRYYYPEVQVQ